MENPRLAPIGSLWSETYKLFSEKFWIAVQILFLPTALLTIGGILGLQGVDPRLQIIGGLLRIAGGVLSIPISASLILLFNNENGTPGDLYKKGFEWFWPLVWIVLLSAVITLGGFVMLIVPGIIIGVWIAFSQFALVLEDKRGLNSLLQSRAYVEGYWWAIVGRVILLTIAAGVVYGILAVIFVAIGGPIGALILSLFYQLFFVPFSVAYSYVIFKNLRSIKPDLVSKQSSKGRAFFITSGIVGVAMPFILIILTIVFVGVIAVWVAQHAHVSTSTYSGMGSTSLSAPIIRTISPQNIPVGAQVVIYGTGFGATGTIEFDGLVGPGFVNASSDPLYREEFEVSVPQTLAPYCRPDQACAQFLKDVTPGTYQVTVITNGTTTNAVPLTISAAGKAAP